MINILIVEDTDTETLILKKIFESEPDMRVVGCAKNGKIAVDLVAKLKPTLVTMDIQMPIMDGLDAIRQIMSHHPTPIVVISSHLNDDGMKINFCALEAGALTLIEKPKNFMSPAFEPVRKSIIDSVRNMAEIHVVKRRFHTRTKSIKLPKPFRFVSLEKNFELVAIGTSVGGPQVLKRIFSELSATFPLPIVVVQHMSPGFMGGFIKWLNDDCLLTVKIAEHMEILRPGYIYFAPDYHHLEIDRVYDNLTVKLVKSLPVSGFCPSATVLLESVAKTCGKNAIGLLLTGMGNDGAQGLLELKKAGGHTIIQDSHSAIVFGMAGVAQSLGAVDRVLDLENISNYLTSITKIKEKF